MADEFDFDVLDATKIIPEEIVPLELGRKDGSGSQCPTIFLPKRNRLLFVRANLVPGIDFSEDPLLQGRLFSYLDTQLSRLGGPNFHQLPINAPKCPFHNFQRDGIHQMQVFKGRVSYEPNSLDPNGPRESQGRGFRTSERPIEGALVRARSESFSDHYSQARLFYRSITPPEQKHLANALTFELSKVEGEQIRLRMLGHLALIDKALGEAVSGAMGATGKAEKIVPAKNPIDLAASPAVRLYGKTKPTLQGRKVGLLVGEGFDSRLARELIAQIEKEGAKAPLITSKIQGELDSEGRIHPGDLALRASPSVLFDAAAILSGEKGDMKLASDLNAVGFLMDALRHCKAVGISGVAALSEKANLEKGPGVVNLSAASSVKEFVSSARQGRFWEREKD